MPRFYTNSCNPVYGRWNFTSENIFDYSDERTASFDIQYDGSWLKLDKEKQEDKIVIENDVVVSKKSIAYGCKIINDRPIEVGDFVVVDDTFDSYNTVCVVMEVARSYLCLYRFKNNDLKNVRPSPFRAYIPNDKVKEETVNLANCTICKIYCFFFNFIIGNICTEWGWTNIFEVVIFKTIQAKITSSNLHYNAYSIIRVKSIINDDKISNLDWPIVNNLTAICNALFRNNYIIFNHDFILLFFLVQFKPATIILNIETSSTFVRIIKNIFGCKIPSTIYWIARISIKTWHIQYTLLLMILYHYKYLFVKCFYK